jgi:hypothetical protein
MQWGEAPVIVLAAQHGSPIIARAIIQTGRAGQYKNGLV